MEALWEAKLGNNILDSVGRRNEKVIGLGCYSDGPPPIFASWGLQYVLVPDDIRQCVVFVGGMEGDRFRPRATGFLVTYEEHNLRFSYLVTAEHVISGMLTRNIPLYCRINLVNGDVGTSPIPNDAWKFYPNERRPSDIAVCPITEFATVAGGATVPFIHKTIALNGTNAMAATESVIEERRIGVGEEILITGLFRGHFGDQKNIPIVRIGNIAMLKDEPVWTQHPGGPMDAHLVEARSIDGLSGSPVFVNLPPIRIIDGDLVSAKTGDHIFYLFGMMHGHFDIRNVADDSSVQDELGGSINTGIGVVIPVDKIIETIEQPEFVGMRREGALLVAQRRGATPD